MFNFSTARSSVTSSTTSCLSATSKLLHRFGLPRVCQVNQVKGARFPHPTQYSTECHHICYIARIICTHINSYSLCRYIYTLLHASLCLLCKRKHEINLTMHKYYGGSNYDSLFARTVAFPVQAAYWTKEVIAPCGYSVPIF